MTLQGRRVLVLGASGFLGGRLAERLVLEHGARVRVLVRRVMGAAALARLPVEVHVGDLLDRDALAAAAAGTDVIFNCTKGTGADARQRRAVDVDGAALVVAAAGRSAARVVHTSSMAVYDRPADGEFDEGAPAAPSGDSYADGKRLGERAALSAGARAGVSVVVVQPTVVYGPNAGVYGTEILDEMAGHRLILVNGGTGICNAVYVDDAVTGLLLAATTDGIAGQRLLISGPQHPTWAEFFGCFERMVGERRTVSLDEDAALALWRGAQRRSWLAAEGFRVLRQDPAVRGRLLATREGAALRWMWRRLVPASVAGRLRGRPQDYPDEPHARELPIAPLRPWVVQNLARRARVRIDKARALLGYEPVFQLSDGMHLTELWARWAGVLPGGAEPGLDAAPSAPAPALASPRLS